MAAHAVRIKTEKSGKPDEAMAILLSLGRVLQQPPAQTKWNSPMIHVYSYCQDKLSLQWSHLVKQFPDDVSVRYNAGLWMMHARKFEDAATHLRAATESQHLPEAVRGTALKNLGLALMKSGQTTEAEAALHAALELAQPDLQAWCLLMDIYKQANRIEEATRAEANCPGRTINKETAQ